MAWRAGTDTPWKLMAAPLPLRRRHRRGGRPPLSDRRCFEGILWVLWTGAPWSARPTRYGSKRAGHAASGREPSPVCCCPDGARCSTTATPPRRSAGTRAARGPVRDGAQRGDRVGKTARGQGTTRRVVADGQGLPLGVGVGKSSPSEVKLLERTCDNVRVKRRRGHHCRPHQPQRLIADRGDKSNRVRALLGTRDIEPVIPKRRHNTRATHQDGRKLRRYRRRRLIEWTNAWWQNFRRLVVRDERAVRNFEALVHMACVRITRKKVSG